LHKNFQPDRNSEPEWCDEAVWRKDALRSSGTSTGRPKSARCVPVLQSYGEAACRHRLGALGSSRPPRHCECIL